MSKVIFPYTTHFFFPYWNRYQSTCCIILQNLVHVITLCWYLYKKKKKTLCWCYLQEQYWSKELSVSAVGKHNPARTETVSNAVEIPTDGTDVWEIDTRQLTVGEKVGSGSFGDLWVICLKPVPYCVLVFSWSFFSLEKIPRYKGTYFSQEVAVKFLKPERVNKEMLREFSQEVYIMRLVWMPAYNF